MKKAKTVFQGCVDFILNLLELLVPCGNLEKYLLLSDKAIG